MKNFLKASFFMLGFIFSSYSFADSDKEIILPLTCSVTTNNGCSCSADGDNNGICRRGDDGKTVHCTEGSNEDTSGILCTDDEDGDGCSCA